MEDVLWAPKRKVIHFGVLSWVLHVIVLAAPIIMTTKKSFRQWHLETRVSYCHPMTVAAEPRGRERRMWVINYGEIPLNLCNTVLKLTTIHLFMLTFGGGFLFPFHFNFI